MSRATMYAHQQIQMARLLIIILDHFLLASSLIATPFTVFGKFFNRGLRFRTTIRGKKLHWRF